jgi:pimeloyl-ACP methyl ester carboxylesterase
MTDLPVWVDGEGDPLVLVHAGVADHRMWEPLVALLAPRRRVIRYDMRGFGAAPSVTEPFSASEDLGAVLDSVGVDRADVMGNSNGGRVALQFAIEHPDRVGALTLLAAALPEHDWSEQVVAAWEAAEEASGIDAVVDANVRAWLAGPCRAVEDMEPELRTLAADMALRAEEHYMAGTAEERDPAPPLGSRLGAVRAQTLVVDGALDFPDFRAIADRLAGGIAGAERVTVEDVAHLIPLEAPEVVAELVR